MSSLIFELRSVSNFFILFFIYLQKSSYFAVMKHEAIPEEQHNIEIQENLKHWNKKAVLRKVYAEFYKMIKINLNLELDGKIVELGSGIGNLKSIVPNAICTDLFDNPWLDKIENAYKLSFDDNTVSNLVLFDVWHHLEFPGTALQEFKRVLKPGGRVVIFEPYISLFSRIIFGLAHHEPIGKGKDIRWTIPSEIGIEELGYYAAQGNASVIFYKRKFRELLKDWNTVTRKRLPGTAYILSGGYSKPQMYPSFMYPAFGLLDLILGLLPTIFATRTMVVLELK